MKAAISTLVFVLAINGGSAWPYVEGFSSVDTKSSSCHFLDASPFFRTHPSTQTDVRSSEELDEIVLLTEFSRFMNAKAMDLLQEFAEIKKLYEVKKQFQHFHDTPAMTRRSDVRGARDLKVIDPKPEPVPTTFFKTALAQEDMMRGDRIISTLDPATPTPIWNSVCFLVWFPYHKDKCNQLRCTACTPSIMTADVVCKRASPDMKSTHKCIQNVMGEGRCNYCITDFLHA
ncbi:hypothetical protein TCAL_06113 [Tigriopus californicus]|uniref:Uncharacterized protein n=1 Tax=Tigriopus californicus TaxID=6832 RepID=A0A553NYQ9_TIGCA|nr:hypothetical protein TCAL_06113 [Tigriopus californicus]